MLLDPLCEQTRKLVVGPGDQPGVDVGPLIRAEHRDRVAHYVDQGVAEAVQQACRIADIGKQHRQVLSLAALFTEVLKDAAGYLA